MNKYKRIITIILDSVGIGALPDAEKYGDDQTVNTLGNISKTVGLNIPNLEKLGLGNIFPLKTVKSVEKPLANYGKMAEKADGKDSVTGHWELMGVTLEKGFNQFVKNGFPAELITEFEKRVGRKVLANKEASGMKVIKEYFDEHVKTGSYIVYTSVDSTFQIAAHEEVVPLEELYKASKIARELTKDPKYNISRVIARPFKGTKENYYRTANRHDYALKPNSETVMEKLKKKELSVYAIGKINDLFSGVGITTTVPNKSNMNGVDNTIEALKSKFEGFIFTNLVDFDSVYGHPRDVKGYKKALEEFDQRIPEIINNLNNDDLLVLTADHGNDPTFRGNDHTREYVPLLVYSKKLEGNNKIPIRNTFEDLGETICENFGLSSTENGTSFLKDLK